MRRCREIGEGRPGSCDAVWLACDKLLLICSHKSGEGTTSRTSTIVQEFSTNILHVIFTDIQLKTIHPRSCSTLSSVFWAPLSPKHCITQTGSAISLSSVPRLVRSFQKSRTDFTWPVRPCPKQLYAIILCRESQTSKMKGMFTAPNYSMANPDPFSA